MLSTEHIRSDLITQENISFELKKRASILETMINLDLEKQKHITCAGVSFIYIDPVGDKEAAEAAIVCGKMISYVYEEQEHRYATEDEATEDITNRYTRGEIPNIAEICGIQAKCYLRPLPAQLLLDAIKKRETRELISTKSYFFSKVKRNVFDEDGPLDKHAIFKLHPEHVLEVRFKCNSSITTDCCVNKLTTILGAAYNFGRKMKHPAHYGLIVYTSLSNPEMFRLKEMHEAGPCRKHSFPFQFSSIIGKNDITDERDILRSIKLSVKDFFYELRGSDEHEIYETRHLVSYIGVMIPLIRLDENHILLYTISSSKYFIEQKEKILEEKIKGAAYMQGL